MEEASIMQQTGAKLRHFRVLKGISQEQLALDCDLNVNTIGMIERGQKNATIFTLFAVPRGSERYLWVRSAPPVPARCERAANRRKTSLGRRGQFDRASRNERAEVCPCASAF